jgi:hypothetical protein
MGQFYYAQKADGTMIFAKSMYPKRKDCVNVCLNIGKNSVTAKDVKKSHAVVTYDDVFPIAVVLTPKGIGTIPVWVILL